MKGTRIASLTVFAVLAAIFFVSCNGLFFPSPTNNGSSSSNSNGSTPSVPQTPTGLQVSGATPTTLNISWSQCSGATSYSLFRATTATGSFTSDEVYSGANTNFTDTGLSSSTTYYYEVEAENASGGSAMSSAVAGTTSPPAGPAKPATPTGLTVGSPTATTLTVSWTASTGATDYEVYRDTSATGLFNDQVYSGAGASFTDKSLTPSTTYYYEVQATNSGGSSALSSPASGTTNGTVTTPTFSVASGTYPATQNVTVQTVTKGASIRYTTDGSSPTSTSGTLYTGTIGVSTTTTINAIAYMTGWADSSVATASYTIKAIAIAAGYDDSFAVSLTTDSLLGWGGNYNGELGNGTTTSSSTPVTVSGMSGVLDISTDGDASPTHTLAVRSDGTVWAWGDNDCGQLGNNTTTNSSVPVQAYNLTGMKGVAGAAAASIAVSSSGTVYEWGCIIGASTSHIPVQVSGLSNITAVSAGFGSYYALRSDGTVWTWGSNSSSPIEVSGLSNIVAIAAGDGYCLALDGSGNVWSWGSNTYGNLGNGNTSQETTPVEVTALWGYDIVAIAAGSGHSIALASNGTVWAWGYNAYGQLGIGSTTNSSTPVQVSGLSNIVQVAAGNNHTLALARDGKLWVWGANGSGQLGDGSTLGELTPKNVSW